MELLAGLVALLASVGGGAGYWAEQAARQILLAQLDSAEVLEVRIQSQPNYRLLNGQVERLLVAGRGLYRAPFPRVERFELETDPIAIDPAFFLGDPLRLRQPLQAAFQVVVREEDLNAALNSPEVLRQFQDIQADLPLGGRRNAPRYFELRQPRAKLLEPDRLQLAALLVEKEGDSKQAVEVVFNAGIQVEGGRRLRLQEPEFTIGSVRVPDEITQAFLGGLNQVFDLQELEKLGILVRVLKLEIAADQMQVIGFARVENLEALTRAQQVSLR
ncbi:DUF2993 domain-containing protein [Synechococcus sp. H70.2]|uniref:LmeA family phospholipid-binding protein n=1 Tax=unclassified Synechococcus TaxID=2626047 RepID=UPI0039C46A76